MRGGSASSAPATAISSGNSSTTSCPFLVTMKVWPRTMTNMQVCNAVLRLRGSSEHGTLGIRNLDFDPDRRDVAATIHPHLDVVLVHRHVLGDDRHNLLAENGEQIGLTARRPLVGQQNLKPLARYRSGTPPPE